MIRDGYYSRNDDCIGGFISEGTGVFVGVVKDDRDGSFCDTSMSKLVDEFLKGVNSCLSGVRISQKGHTNERVVKPRTKQIASRIFDFPDPFRPVMALNCGSKPVITVRFA